MHSLSTHSAGSDTVNRAIVAYDSGDARALIDKVNAHNAELYGHPDQTPVSTEEFDPEHGGLFVVAYVDGQPVACGGYRRHLEDPSGATVEIKRMYVEETHRRSGLARRVLRWLEDAAFAAGYREAILDCGSKQSPAHALYESCGYVRIESFSIYKDKPGNRAYGKPLASTAGSA
ncbi:GNAT family N-acetyltransferase [Nocardia noduli]|uniref:GNAT family N-acetyltransferase n=1 Tax=Nocardia noduli TaxID=2815722 RepID=UPI001C25035E|nr:GNAT family N-acetyltransferase [Nocardia noduli]